MFIPANERLTMLRSNGVIDAGGLLVAPNIETAHLLNLMSGAFVIFVEITD